MLKKYIGKYIPEIIKDLRNDTDLTAKERRDRIRELSSEFSDSCIFLGDKGKNNKEVKEGWLVKGKLQKERLPKGRLRRERLRRERLLREDDFLGD